MRAYGLSEASDQKHSEQTIKVSQTKAIERKSVVGSADCHSCPWRGARGEAGCVCAIQDSVMVKASKFKNLRSICAHCEN